MFNCVFRMFGKVVGVSVVVLLIFVVLFICLGGEFILEFFEGDFVVEMCVLLGSKFGILLEVIR